MIGGTNNDETVGSGVIRALVIGYETRISELEKENRNLQKIALIQSQHVTELIAQLKEKQD